METDNEKTWNIWVLSKSDIVAVWKEKCEQTRDLTDLELDRIAYRFEKGFDYIDWEDMLQGAIEHEIPECKYRI